MRSLIDHGMFVTLYGHPKKTDMVLRRFADHYCPLDYRLMASMCNPEIRHEDRVRYSVNPACNNAWPEMVKRARIGGLDYFVGKKNDEFHTFIQSDNTQAVCTSLEPLLIFLKSSYGAEDTGRIRRGPNSSDGSPSFLRS